MNNTKKAQNHQTQDLFPNAMEQYIGTMQYKYNKYRNV